MINEVHDRSEPSMASLVGGIVDDVQTLIKQQLKLTRHEIEVDLRKTKEAATMLILGAGILFIGAVVFCLGLVHLLHWAGNPAPSDPTRLPWWACYGIVSVAILVLGGIVAVVGRARFAAIKPLDNTAEGLKENVEWATNPK